MNATACARCRRGHRRRKRRWNFESNDFLSNVPVNDMCADGAMPVYRAYNNGFARGIDSNYRITSSAAAIDAVVGAAGSTKAWSYAPLQDASLDACIAGLCLLRRSFR